MTIKTVGDLRKSLKGFNDDAPIAVFSMQYDNDTDQMDDVQCHYIKAVGTGWYLNDNEDTVNIHIHFPFDKA